MFLSLRSPFGGNRLASNWVKEARRSQNLKIAIQEHPEIIEDKWCLKVGYCDTCGEHIYVTPTVAEFLFKLFYKKFNKPS
jgi:hypothetical protein